MIKIIFNYLILTLLILVIAITYFFVGTTPGLELGLQLAATHLPGKLQLENLHGKLLSGFSCQNLSYESDSIHLTASSIDFHWNPLQLFNRIVDIQQLTVNDLTVKTVTTNTQSASHFEFGDIAPVLRHLLARNVTINHFSLTQNQTTNFKLNTIELKQNERNNSLFLDGTLKGYPVHGSIKLKLEPHEIQIQEANLLVANSTVNLTGSVNKNWNIQWNIHVPNLNTLYANSRGNFFSSGAISGARLSPTIQAKFQGDQLVFEDKQAKQLRGELDLTFKPNTPSYLKLKISQVKIQDYRLKQLELGCFGLLSQNTGQYSTTFDVAINKKNYSNISVAIPTSITLDNYATQHLSIKIKFNIPSLTEFATYIPNTKNLRGKVFGALEFKGTLQKLIATGDVNLMNGAITIPKVGITLRNMHFHAYGNETKLLTYKGIFDSNTGNAEIQGSTNLAENNFPTSLTIDGKNLQIANLPEYKIFVNPALKIQLTNESINVSGNITIPTATIHPKDFRTTVTLPSDVVFVNQKKSNSSALLALAPTMQVTVSLGDAVEIHYQDLNTTLRGNLFIIKQPNSLITATGSLYTLNGTYNAYGQILKIQEGRLIYIGGMITNPGLNIKAVRQIKTVLTDSFNGLAQSYGGSQLLTVGVQILGTFDTPAMTLFSDPSSLSQSNILSYLILGTAAPSSGNQKATLLSAAAAMNLSGNSPSKLSSITKTLQDRLGLNELNVESVQSFNPAANQNNGGTVDNTSLVLGKEIAHNLYLHSSVSLFASPPVYVFNVQYKLSKHWSIQSETSTIDTGADLLYSIERE